MIKSSWLKTIYDIAEIIEREGEITEVQLLLKTRLSVWTLPKLKPILLQLNPNIKYNKTQKIFYFSRQTTTLLSTTDLESLK